MLDDLKAYWKFDESSGNATDSSGNSHTLINHNSTAYATGKINNGADLELGSSNYFSIADHADFDFSTACSFSFWIKPESLEAGTELSLIVKYGDSNNRPYRFNLIVSAGDVQSFFFQSDAVAGTADSVTGTWTAGTDFTAMDAGSWYHIVLVYNGGSSNVTLYINGASKGAKSATSSLFNGNADLKIGAGGDPAGEFFDGIIDELGMWARVLSSDEVSSLYNGGAGLTYPFVSDPPSVSTDEADEISFNSAVLNGEITATGGENADKRGFVWGTTSKSAPGDVAPASSGYDSNDVAIGDFGAGVFDYELLDLDSDTTYYFRAFAHNSEGYAYGDELEFQTETEPFEPRRLQNKAGVVFDSDKTYIMYAEDFNSILDRLDALEES